MDRREFLKRLASLGAAGAAALLSRGSGRAWAAAAAGGAAAGAASGALPDLVAVKGGDPASMLDLALSQMGGMGAFVRKGQTVVVKPNIGWDRPPEAAANTNPQLVKRVIEQCLAAGAKKVWVFDNSCDSGPRCYASSQIERFAKDAGAEVVSGASSSYYHEVPIPRAVNLKKTKVHELILQADVFINVPILKNHSGAGMTCAMKNLMGIVWDRGEFHANNLDQCIADSCLYRKPNLNIVDAWKVMLSGGPRGYSSSKYSEEKMLMLSTDIVAIDSASSRALGYQPERFDYIGMGEKLGLGRSDTSKLDIRRLTM
jgi:uncharacterized protein (DUF362 family)